MFFDSEPHGAPASEPSAHTPKGLVVWTRNKFLAGLAVATPLIITYWILEYIYNKLHGWSLPLQQSVVDGVNAAAGQTIINTESTGFIIFERCVGVMIPLVVLVALGTLASNVIGRRIVEAVDRLLLRLPFIRFIYKALKQVIDSFKNFGGTKGFKRVVYIDYPVPGAWMLGFVTGQFYDAKRRMQMSVVFVPGALSPMTGLLLSVESERLSDAPMSMEEAMKMVFSGGLVVPSSTNDNIPAPPAGVPPAAPVPRPDLPPGLPVADADEGTPQAAAAKVAPNAEPQGLITPVLSAWQRLRNVLRGLASSR